MPEGMPLLASAFRRERESKAVSPHGNKRDSECDVLVIGSGGAGLTAALTAALSGAEVIVAEAAPGLGGSTLFSGALAWVPNNHLMKEAGLEDSSEDVLAYMKACMPERNDESRWLAFAEAAPEMLRFVEANTPLDFRLTIAPDSFAEKHGGKPMGRNVEPTPLNPAILGDWQDLLFTSPHPTVPVTLGEAFEFVTRSTSRATALREKLRLAPALLKRRLAGKRTMGLALITGLLKGCRDAGVKPMVGARARRLVMQDGGVVGAEAKTDDGTILLRARRAVILATGGFEWNRGLVEEYIPGPVEFPHTTPFARGDGLLMAGEAGAKLQGMDEIMMWHAARLPGQPRFFGEDIGILVNPVVNNPHTVMVNRAGERFVNEPSHNAPQAYHQKDGKGEFPNLPAWSVFDTNFRAKYAEEAMDIVPGRPDPDWLAKDESLEGLARQVGIDAAGLAKTVERFNRFARERKDLDFHRGEFHYDWHFVPNVKDNPNLGVIEKPPFYALRLYPGTVGTKGGPATDEYWRVLGKNNLPISGLYAVGTCSAAIIGPITISSSSAVGLIMTQGFIAGRHAMG